MMEAVSLEGTDIQDVVRFDKSTLDAMPQIVWMASPGGSILYFNRAWYEHTGLDADHSLGNAWRDVIHPDDLDECNRVAEESVHMRVPFRVEYRLWHAADSTWRWQLSRTIPVKDPDGTLVRWVGVCNSIDEHKKQLEAGEDLFRAAMNMASDAIFMLDRATMRFTDCNETACRLFGYSREELLEIGPSDLGGGSRERLEAVYDEIISGRHFPEIEGLFRRKDGCSFPVEIRRRALSSEKKHVIVLAVRDISERKEAESRVEQLSFYDQLTSLPNRPMFHECLRNALAQAEAQHLTISVLIINLDRLKNVNDMYGLFAGDELLRQLAIRLINGLRIRDIVGRLGGDEFGIILFNSEHSQGTSITANKVFGLLRKPFDLRGNSISTTASMGIAVFPNDAHDADTMMKCAALAMHEAKRAGGNVFRFHTAEMNTRLVEKFQLHEALGKALESDEFILYYQPKINIETGKWDSVEALLRWNRPGHGLVSPAEFIPALEETGMIVPAGEWVIRAACRQIKAWMPHLGPIRIAVNVSAVQFLQRGLMTSIAGAIKENGIDPTLLEIEITESSLMADASRTASILAELKALGVHLSIDDFGTGYSSLAYLKQFPIDKVKIDIAFIRDIVTSASDAAITTAIINMAHSLNLKVIAEGVETGEQLAFLRERKCDEFQGFYFSKPLPAGEIENLWQADVTTT